MYGVVLKEQFFEVTTAVSGDGGYIEHVVSTIQSFLNNKTNRKQLPGYAPTGDPERKPVIAGGTLVIGNMKYDLDEIQSAKADTIRITNGFWTTQSQSVGFALLCTGLYTGRWGLYLVAVPAILLFLGVSAISFYVSGSRAALAHIVTVKGTFGSAIIYASTVKREVDDMVTAIRTGMKGEPQSNMAGHS